jgi:hypothetical protein
VASTYAKRLAKLEELLADKVNQPLAYLWLEDGETHEECCIRCGYDPSQIDRITFIRWLDPALGEGPKEYGWDVPEAGPPKDPEPTIEDDAGQIVRGDAQRSEAGATPAARDPDFEQETRYREALERREREDIQDKLDIAAKAFARSIA